MTHIKVYVPCHAFFDALAYLGYINMLQFSLFGCTTGGWQANPLRPPLTLATNRSTRTGSSWLANPIRYPLTLATNRSTRTGSTSNRRRLGGITYDCNTTLLTFLGCTGAGGRRGTAGGRGRYY